MGRDVDDRRPVPRPRRPATGEVRPAVGARRGWRDRRAARRRRRHVLVLRRHASDHGRLAAWPTARGIVARVTVDSHEAAASHDPAAATRPERPWSPRPGSTGAPRRRSSRATSASGPPARRPHSTSTPSRSRDERSRSSSPAQPASSAPTSPSGLLADGHARRAARRVHRLLRALAQGRERRDGAAAPGCRRSSSSTSAPTTSPRPLDGVDRVVHLAAMPGLPRSWTEMETYTSLQPHGDVPAAGGRPRGRDVSGSSRSRRRRSTARTRRRRDAAAPAGLALRRHQARRRVPRPGLRADARVAGRRSCATSRSTARGSGRTWPTTGSSRRCSTASRSDGLRRRPPDARQHVRRRCRRRHASAPSRGRGRRGLQHRRRRADRAARRDPHPRRGDRRRARPSSSRPPRPGDQRHTGADTSKAAARPSATRRPGRRPMACGPRSTGTGRPGADRMSDDETQQLAEPVRVRPRRGRGPAR